MRGADEGNSTMVRHVALIGLLLAATVVGDAKEPVAVRGDGHGDQSAWLKTQSTDALAREHSRVAVISR